MDQIKTIEFQGQNYFDDRLFVLYLCKGIVEIEPNDEGIVWTKIYHEKAPDNYIWCVATYRNCNRYPLYRVDSFYKKEDAEKYIKEIEPETPLISLGGNSPVVPFSYEEYSVWKVNNKFTDYNWQLMYFPGGTDASESIGQTKEQFQGIK